MTYPQHMHQSKPQIQAHDQQQQALVRRIEKSAAFVVAELNKRLVAGENAVLASVGDHRAVNQVPRDIRVETGTSLTGCTEVCCSVGLNFMGWRIQQKAGGRLEMSTFGLPQKVANKVERAGNMLLAGHTARNTDLSKQSNALTTAILASKSLMDQMTPRSLALHFGRHNQRPQSQNQNQQQQQRMAQRSACPVDLKGLDAVDRAPVMTKRSKPCIDIEGLNQKLNTIAGTAPVGPSVNDERAFRRYSFDHDKEHRRRIIASLDQVDTKLRELLKYVPSKTIDGLCNLVANSSRSLHPLRFRDQLRQSNGPLFSSEPILPVSAESTVASASGQPTGQIKGWNIYSSVLGSALQFNGQLLGRTFTVVSHGIPDILIKDLVGSVKVDLKTDTPINSKKQAVEVLAYCWDTLSQRVESNHHVFEHLYRSLLDR